MSKIKVGDRIRIFHDHIITTGEILHIDGCFISYKCDKNNGPFKAHIKQCRKLVKKQPREWWVCNLVSSIGEQTCVISPHKPENTDGWICLREVKKK